jgi:hypothetical protein
MKRIRLLVLLGVVAVALPLGVAFAGNAGATDSTTTVGIRQYADFNLAGFELDVGLNVRCTGGLGTATVEVTQKSPETGITTTGSGANPDVVCDGRTHSVGVTVAGPLCDPGKAYAKAHVTSMGGTADAARQITVLVV